MFRVVHIRHNNQHRGYEIWYNDKPLVTLKDMRTPDGVPCSCFKRHEAYALARIWNGV